MKRNFFPAMTAIMVLALAVAAHAQPANDECASAIAVANHSVTALDMTGATRSSDTVSCNTSSSRLDIWYSYTTAGPELVTVSQCGSPVGTRRILAAFAGGCGGTQVACDENTLCGTQQPLITFESTGITTYIICVNIRGVPGPMTGFLTVDAVPSPPSGSDICSGATSVVDGDNFVRNTSATQDTQIPCAVGGAGNSGVDVWYSYTAPVTGIRNFEITSFKTLGGTARNSTLAIYDACGGTLLACDDNGGVSTAWSKIYHFPVIAGSQYKVRFSGWGNAATGIGILNIAPPRMPVTFDDCELAVAVAGQGSVPFSTVGLTNSDRKAWDCKSYNKDGWFAWTPSISGVGVIDGCSANGAASLTIGLYDACGNAPLICSGVTWSGFLDPPNNPCFPRICADVIAGHTYVVRFGVLFDYNTASGDLIFDVRPPNAGITIPPGALAEPGNCGDAPAGDVNGGCNVTPNTLPR